MLAKRSSINAAPIRSKGLTQVVPSIGGVAHLEVGPMDDYRGKHFTEPSLELLSIASNKMIYCCQPKLFMQLSQEVGIDSSSQAHPRAS